MKKLLKSSEFIYQVIIAIIIIIVLVLYLYGKITNNFPVTLSIDCLFLFAATLITALVALHATSSSIRMSSKNVSTSMMIESDSKLYDEFRQFIQESLLISACGDLVYQLKTIKIFGGIEADEYEKARKILCDYIGHIYLAYSKGEYAYSRFLISGLVEANPLVADKVTCTYDEIIDRIKSYYEICDNALVLSSAVDYVMLMDGIVSNRSDMYDDVKSLSKTMLESLRLLMKERVDNTV